MGWKFLTVLAAVGMLALQGTAALAAQEGVVQAATGTVVAVTEASKTLVIESSLGGKPWIVGAEVADNTKFEGKAKGLKDLKAGDKVTIRFVVGEHGAVARSVTTR